MPAHLFANAIYLLLGAAILRVLLLLIKWSSKTKINNMDNTPSPPPPAEVSSDPAAPMDSCPPASKTASPRHSPPVDILSSNHPAGERFPPPSRQSKNHKRGLKSKKPLLHAEPSTFSSASESEKGGSSRVRLRGGERSNSGRVQGLPPPSPTTEKPTPPAELVMTNLKKASGQKPPKKKHLTKQDDEDEWRIEPELPDDMRKWGAFSDSLSIFPKRDPKLKRSRVIRKDAVARMLRFLVARMDAIDSASDSSSCRNYRKVVFNLKETIDKPCEDLPPPKEPVPLPEGDFISGACSPPHYLEAGYTVCPINGSPACPCTGEEFLDVIIPEGSVLNPHYPAHQDHSIRTLLPTKPGSESSPKDLHVEGGTPTNDDPQVPYSLSEENDIANPSALSWNDSADSVLETSL